MYNGDIGNNCMPEMKGRIIIKYIWQYHMVSMWTCKQKACEHSQRLSR